MTWRPHRVSYQMRWLGEKLTLGAYGTDPESYGDFPTRLETAPVLVPGHDRPVAISALDERNVASRP